MVYFSFSFSHHGKYSSYHRLLNYCGPEDAVVDASLPSLFYKRWFNPRDITVTSWRVHCEKRALKIARQQNHDWIHYLYPEHSCYNLRRINRGDARVVMSCHLPAEKMKSSAGRPEFKKSLEHASALITMSPDDISYYEEVSPNAKVEFIPHGIDVHHFQPPSKEDIEQTANSSVIRTLTVGNMMRDFDLLAKTINLAGERKLDIRFRVVANQIYLDRVKSLLTTKGKLLFEPYCGVSDAKLISLYHTSHLLFLPLIAATANNAVMEAMACGLPMLLTDLPATRIYTEDTAKYFSENDPGTIIDLIIELAGNTQQLAQFSQAIRDRAVSDFSWEAIAKRQNDFLAKV